MSPVNPSTTLRAFSCPHCKALTTQFWRTVFLAIRDDKRLPLRLADWQKEKADLGSINDVEERKKAEAFGEKLISLLPFIGGRTNSYVQPLHNVDVAECFNCNKISIWVGNNMIWPQSNPAPLPSPDLPADVYADFVEAGNILDLSPRGAAALLRLAIQKLCLHLGEKGKNINDDIASLVKKGLDPRIQKALDIVRVVGNNAVHPGEINLNDDKQTAESIFNLVNLIADVMITQPRAVESMYNNLGEKALAAIETRDK